MENSRKLRRVTEPAELPEYLVAFLQQHVSPASHLSLALSGGLDSCVLLDLLVQTRFALGFQFSAIHVNHQISSHADEWAEFCAQLCKTYDVPLISVKVDVPRDSGQGLEAAARDIRYAVLLARAKDALLLGQHQDDQAETLMLQLLRGSGVDGLAAMPTVLTSLPKPLLRPFLEFPRSMLKTYAYSRNLRWIEDESNQDNHYDRNFLRHKVLPEIENRFPAYRATLSRVAENVSDASDLLAELAAEDAAKAIDEQRLDIAWMKTRTRQRSMNLLRWWIERETGMSLSRARLLNIWDQLLNARINAQIDCQLGHMVLRRYRHWAYISRREFPSAYHLVWQGEDTLDLPDGNTLRFREVTGQGICANEIEKGFIITNRFGMEYGWELTLQPDCRRPVRTLKNLWQEAGVPPWERDSMPLVWCKNELIFVLGLGINCANKAKKNEKGIVIDMVNLEKSKC